MVSPTRAYARVYQLEAWYEVILHGKDTTVIIVVKFAAPSIVSEYECMSHV